MKITIDTKEDSHQEIQKVVNMLTSLMQANEGRGVERNSGNLETLQSEEIAPSEPAPILEEGIFSMFSSNQEKTADAQISNREKNADDILNENKEASIDASEPNVVENLQHKSDEEPKVVTY